ncbi:unnamed protein product, partial [Prorocentrum cordatum]
APGGGGAAAALGAAGAPREACEPRLSQLGASQPSQPGQLDGAAAEEVREQARAALEAALCRHAGGALAPPEASARVRAMAVAALAYWQDAHVDLNRAASGLHRFLDQHRRLYWRRPPWRGVNLGGWLLLEPGPSAPFFERLGPQCGCEWSLLKSLRLRLGDEGAAEEVRAHRKSFVSEADISQIRALGMNAVRIPLGYWVVTGPTDGDLFVGPGLEHLDRVLGWCQASWCGGRWAAAALAAARVARGPVGTSGGPGAGSCGGSTSPSRRCACSRGATAATPR